MLTKILMKGNLDDNEAERLAFQLPRLAWRKNRVAGYNLAERFAGVR